MAAAAATGAVVDGFGAGEAAHLRMNGRNSSSLVCGNVGPSVSGSSCGDRKPISRFST